MQPDINNDALEEYFAKERERIKNTHKDWFHEVTIKQIQERKAQQKKIVEETRKILNKTKNFTEGK